MSAPFSTMLIAVVGVVLSTVLCLHGADGLTPSPECTVGALMRCFFPPMDLMMSPAGRAMVERVQRKSRMPNIVLDELVTREDVAMMCQIASTSGQCVGGYIRDCYSSNGSNFYRFVNASLHISKALCDRPNLYGDVQIVLRCLMTMDEARLGWSDGELFGSPLDCHNYSSVMAMAEHQAYCQENDVLGEVCCGFANTKESTGNAVESVCSIEAQKVIAEMTGIIDTAYSCADRVMGCDTISQRMRTPNNNCQLAGNDL